MKKNETLWVVSILGLVISISFLHYLTPTMKWQYHLIFMQSYFIPILIAAFQFGIRGGIGTAIVVNIFYLPHIMLQWGGLVEENMMRFLQIFLFYIIGYLTGLKAQREKQEKIRYQQTAQQLQESLNQLKEQSERVRDMEERLQFADRLAVVGEMTASLAHEVRNPLGSIRGVVDIIKEEIPDTKKLNKFLNILLQETNRLNMVVENYLGFVKREQSPAKQIDLREVIHNVKLLMGTRIKKKALSLNIKMPSYPLLIKAHQNDVMQILINLLLNAIQALEPNGTIYLQTDYIENTKEYIYLSVIDNGPGIEENEKEKIFKAFYTTKPEGTGLGLAIVKRIVDQYNWEISLDIKPDHYTQFNITIPSANQ
jgi:signal transduction histidine kinase